MYSYSYLYSYILDVLVLVLKYIDLYSAPTLVYLSLLFNSFVIRGFAPDEFLTGVIIPIPKNKRKSIHDSGNYRGIAVSSIHHKLVDNIILKNYSEV